MLDLFLLLCNLLQMNSGQLPVGFWLDAVVLINCDLAYTSPMDSYHRCYQGDYEGVCMYIYSHDIYQGRIVEKRATVAYFCS